MKTMTLSDYHQKYAAMSVAEIAERASVKDDELTAIFSAVQPPEETAPAKVAVLGCGDRRFVAHHRLLFAKHLRRPVELTTFDITVEHLTGERGVVQHDCTQPLPGGPYDVTFAHVILRFIETERQWDLLQNSVAALKPGGLAIHVLDREDYEDDGGGLAETQFGVPLGRWQEKLRTAARLFQVIPVKYGVALVIKG